jgi:hypothetical protein
MILEASLKATSKSFSKPGWTFNITASRIITLRPSFGWVAKRKFVKLSQRRSLILPDKSSWEDASLLLPKPSETVE